MGGHNYIITGTLSHRHLDVQQAKQGFLDWLLDKLLNTDGRRYSEISSPEYQNLTNRLTEDFLEFLQGQLVSPWVASKHVVDHIESAPIYLQSEYLKGESDPEWHLVFRFSGCTGLCQVIASVCYHWVDLWLQDRFDFIKETFLLPFGFSSRQVFHQDLPMTFIPIEDGHWYASRLNAEYHKDLMRNRSESLPDIKADGNPFDVDLALIEEKDLGEVSRYLDAIWEKHSDLMSDGQCRCQICAPNFLDES